MIWARLRRSWTRRTRPIEVRLLGKPGCGLCREMRNQVVGISRSVPLILVDVDITDDPSLERQYLVEIPVLFVNGELAFRVRAEEAELRERLGRASRSG